jgi:hypothetical protein
MQSGHSDTALLLSYMLARKNYRLLQLTQTDRQTQTDRPTDGHVKRGLL